MQLRDLHYIVAVADSLHFGKASKDCHVSQPTLSMQVKKLEARLGVVLFERNNKTVIVTEAGERIIRQARRILGEAEDFFSLAASLRDPLRGRLRLGLFPTLAPYLLPSLIALLRAELPDLHIELAEEKTLHLVTLLERGALDAALLAMPVESDALESRFLFEDPFQVAMRLGHPLAAEPYLTLDALRPYAMLLLEDGHCLRDQALEVCGLAGIRETQSFRATSLETLRHMVAGSDALTLIPQIALNSGAGSIRYVPLEAPAPARRIGLYKRKTDERDILYARLEMLVRKSAATALGSIR